MTLYFTKKTYKMSKYFMSVFGILQIFNISFNWNMIKPLYYNNLHFVSRFIWERNRGLLSRQIQFGIQKWQKYF